MPKQTINDISMYYQVHGEGEPLVLISGFCSDHNAWIHLTPRLKEHFKVIVLDNRGCGQTDAPHQPYSIEQMADDVKALCQHLNIESATFIGSSMGGFILQMLANRYPQLVKSAIICNSTLNANAPFKYYVEAQLELFKAQAPLHAIYKIVYSWCLSYHYMSQEGALETLISLAMQNPHPMSIAGYEGQMAAIFNFDSSPWVEQLSMPTLVIGGNQDIIFSEPSIQKLANKLPNASYFGFEECGHIPYLEYPELFFEKVLEFISKT